MDISGDYEIPASRETVWAMLNDPEILRQCIPGCETIEMTGEDSFTAKVTLKIGPVKAKFSGDVVLSDKVHPQSYRIGGEGKGGVAGFAKGAADVHLEEVDANTTRLEYKVDAQIGGKIAQLGSRLIDSTTKKLSDKFFDNFTQLVSEQAG